jgi:hypothetical protein
VDSKPVHTIRIAIVIEQVKYLCDVDRRQHCSGSDSYAGNEAAGIQAGQVAIRKGLAEDARDVYESENKHRHFPSPTLDKIDACQTSKDCTRCRYRDNPSFSIGVLCIRLVRNAKSLLKCLLHYNRSYVAWII